MKLAKEEIQKIVLGGILFAFIIYGYFVFLLGPLGTKQDATRTAITELGPKISLAKGQIKRAQAVEETAPIAALTVKQLTATIPDGSPVAWFPTEVGDFFKRQGVDKAATRMNSEMPEKELTGLRRISWGVELPRVEFALLAQAMAAFENEELLAEVISLQIDPVHEDVEMQHAVLTINNLAKQ